MIETFEPAVVTSATLAFKRPLHGIVDRLGTEDIHAGLKIASITNTVAKCAFVIVLGSPRLRRRVAAATATILAGGIVSLVTLVPR